METKGLAHPLRPTERSHTKPCFNSDSADNRACTSPNGELWVWTARSHPSAYPWEVSLSERKFSLFLSLVLVPFGLTEKVLCLSLVFCRPKNLSEAAVAVSVAERSSDIPEYLGSEEKQVSDYTLSPLIAAEREKQREETESLRLLVFGSHENDISKIFRSSIIQDGFSEAFVTGSSSLRIPSTQGEPQSFPSILFLSPNSVELLRSVLEKEEVLAWQRLHLLGTARPFYTH